MFAGFTGCASSSNKERFGQPHPPRVDSAVIGDRPGREASRKSIRPLVRTIE